LDSRGWAVQETLLSHRVLIFGEDQMTWGCAHVSETEWEFEGRFESLHVNRIEFMAKGLSQPMCEKFGGSFWASFTEFYSKHEVTYVTDIFPAISGIVLRIQKLTGDEYYAGLWKQHFLEGLLWHIEEHLNTHKELEGYPGVAKTHREWIAPSWSWASVREPIGYSFFRPTAKYCARLEECSVTHSSLDPFGALTAGFARITGPVTLVTDVQAENKVPATYNPWCMIQLGNGTQIGATVRFDFVHYESCSALMITPYLGVCIRKFEQITDTYVRVGIVEIMRERDNDGLLEKEEVPDLTVSDHFPLCSIVLV
jgi:hypothetical protein